VCVCVCVCAVGLHVGVEGDDVSLRDQSSVSDTATKQSTPRKVPYSHWSVKTCCICERG